MFNIYDTHHLLASVKLLPPIKTFLLDRYFPTKAATDIFATNDVLVEYAKGSKKAAPFVAPRKGGVTIAREGSTMKSFTPSFIAPKRTLTLDDLSKRGFGEALYSELTPEQREGALMVGDLDELRGMVKLRKEAMAAEVMFNNGCIMHEYADGLNKFEEREVRYYDGEENPAIFTPSAKWDTTVEGGKQIIADLDAMIYMLTSRGLPATDLVVAPNVASVLLNNEWIIKLLDTNNYNIGSINPVMLPDGASLLGRLNVNGRIIEVFRYDETYEEIDGTVKSFIPAGKVVVTAPAAGRTVYGAISQVEDSDKKVHTYTGTEVPKYFANVKDDTREVRLASAPLPMPKNENCFISAEVL